MPSHDTLFSSTIRRRSVLASIWLSAPFLTVLVVAAVVESAAKLASSFSAAQCHVSIAKTQWSLSDGTSPSPACVVRNDVMHRVLNFDANEDQSAILPFTLPGPFTGTLNVK